MHSSLNVHIRLLIRLFDYIRNVSFSSKRIIYFRVDCKIYYRQKQKCYILYDTYNFLQMHENPHSAAKYSSSRSSNFLSCIHIPVISIIFDCNSHIIISSDVRVVKRHSCQIFRVVNHSRWQLIADRNERPIIPRFLSHLNSSMRYHWIEIIEK